MIALLCAMLSMPITKKYPATFKGCYDGDTCTFDLVLGNEEIDLGLGIVEQRITIRKDQKIRLCDINAPELKPPNAAATKARDDLVSWISAAKTLSLRVPQKKTCIDSSCDQFEKYGRLLGYIFADDVNLNQKQLAVGNAVSFIQCE